MTNSATRSARTPLVQKLSLACGVVGPLFFIAMFLLEGATRADYNPLRQPVSSLSIGELGWMQQVNFVITGLLIFSFAIGLWLQRSTLRPLSWWAPLLIGLAGIGLMGAGIFVTDPMNGYPPGTPLIPVVRTEHGKLHDLFGIPVFLGLPFAALVFGRWCSRLGERGWATYLVLSGIAMFAFFVLAGMGFSQTPGFADIAGVYQRLSLIVGLGWISLVAVHLMRR